MKFWFYVASFRRNDTVGHPPLSVSEVSDSNGRRTKRVLNVRWPASNVEPQVK
jgi:hypothetical protein